MLEYQNPAMCQWQNQALLGSTRCENPSPAFFELLQKEQALALTIISSFKKKIGEVGFSEGSVS